ncbi:P-loop containing nucleoside triphosphate hydrolase protein [Cristinia sonorae]|uniref:P-loop containing nucleoside triphosphate hydrolase protein n=1 Tax=Cristinia sonorae TaxID=1940300 RepID=A0A8K0UIB0_9AGAR|nr:P-loop containing nucleoside triphosphate hydrolase protein [Cristinia sonorae]
MADIESQPVAVAHSTEHLVLDWDNISYSKNNSDILHNISGRVEAGEMLAVMGPSGAGKSSILDIISRRVQPSSGNVCVNGNDSPNMSELASYVEQSDALLGVLTVRETIQFAARLSLDATTPSDVIRARVAQTISDMGLADVTNNRIGNPIQRGISGGQKRRVTIGSSLVTLPKILILDEPTSGLDSRTSFEVISAIRNIAHERGMIVIASIHQPNWDTISLFDRLLLLAQGRTMFFGPLNKLAPFLDQSLGHPVPLHANPTDHAIDLVNTDFLPDTESRVRHVTEYAERWASWASVNGLGPQYIKNESDEMSRYSQTTVDRPSGGVWQGVKNGLYRTGVLMERNAINYSRNLLAYGVRAGMYIGMGVMLATIWVNLAQTSDKVNDRLSVHFFSVAFLGFMSVAGIPAFLEERQVFMRERLNGLYGPGAYVLANSIVSIPYLFLCSLLFSVLAYWSIGLHPGAGHFFRFLGVLFLAVYTAESQCMVVAAALPIFVAALAIASFLNGFWMSVGGYFIRAVNLPRFWYSWAHWIDFQTYAFTLLTYNDFKGLVLSCTTLADGSCFCDFPSSLEQCKLAGDDVLESLGVGGIGFGLYAGILVIIALVYRGMLYAVLVVKRR